MTNHYPRRTSRLSRWGRTAALLGACLFLLLGTAQAQISVTATAGTPGPTAYTNLRLAFAAINAGTHQGDVTVDITSSPAADGTNVAVLNASGSGAANYTSVLVQPNGTAGARSIAAAPTTNGVIHLNGADNVTIDGRTGDGYSLTISNTATAGTTASMSAIRFTADASDNVVTNCTLLANSTAAAATEGGVVVFSTGTTTGNDNNTISNCDIGPQGATPPSKCIFSAGTTTSLAHHNSGNVIDNCNIYNFFLAAGSRGITLLQGNHAWTITNNRFYQTASRAITGPHYPIEVTASTNNPGGFTIDNNTIGFAAANGTGTYTMTSSGTFRAISLDVPNAGARNSISGNTIRAISHATSSTASGATAATSMINIANGEVDVNTNIIGNQSGAATLTISTGAGAHVHAIFNNAGTNLVTNDNQIGGITITNTTNACNFYALRSVPNTPWECKRNLVGGSVANSMNIGNGSAARTVAGILAAAGTLTADSNTVRNFIVSVGTGAGTFTGIEASGTLLARGNTLQTLDVTGTSTGAKSIAGISLTGSGASTIRRTTINGLTATASTINSSARGILVAGGASAVVDSNSVTNVISVATSGIGFASAIEASGTSLTANYNVISTIQMGGTSSATTPQAIGILTTTSAVNAKGNRISGISGAAGTGVDGSASIIGIAINSGSGTVALDSNTVYDLANTTALTAATGTRTVIGIRVASSGTTTITRNAVYSLRPTSAAGSTSSHASVATGIQVAAGTDNTLRNNMVRMGTLSNGTSITTANAFRGIHVTGTGVLSTIEHNSVYIGGGSVIGTTAPQNTYALLSATTTNSAPSRVYRNNILYNGRSNATTGAEHFAIGVANSNLGNLTSDYNVLYAPGAGGVAGQLGTTSTSFGDWRTVAPIKDANSFEFDPKFQFPEGAINLATPRLMGLHISTVSPTPIEGNGTDVGETEDYNGDDRSALSPTDIGADAGDFTAVLPCNSAPNGGTVSPTSGSGCPGVTVALSSNADNSSVFDVSYQWQYSPDGVGGWTDATGPGSTTLNYTATVTGATLYYRLKATCENTNDVGVSSNNAAVSSTVAFAVYDGVQYLESFESWVTQCGVAASAPTLNWVSIPNGTTTNNAWKRSDHTSWTNTANGLYSPTSTLGSFSARFHSHFVANGVFGDMNLYIDMSGAPGPISVVRFDHINVDGGDVTEVFYSTDGGATFTSLGTVGVSATWTEREFLLPSTSATTVVRIRATGTGTFANSDIGIDNFRILPGCEGTPPPGTASTPTLALCDNQDVTLTFTPGSTDGGLGWQWQRSATGGGVGFSDVGPPNALTYNTGTVSQTWYYQVVTTCVNSGGTNESNELQIDWSPDPPPTVTISPATQNACAGSPAPLTGVGANTYVWSPATYLDSPTGTVVNASVPFQGTSVFTVVGTALSGCTGTATASVTVVAAPFGVVITPSTPAPFCPGGNVNLGAISGVAASTTIYNTASTGTNDYLPFSRVTYPTRRVTYIFAKSLLGIPAGSSLTSLSFHVVTTQSVTVNGFTLKVGNTSSAAGTAVAPTTVWGPEDYTLVTGLNTFQFSTPVVMDGTANIAVDVSYSVSAGSPNPTMNVNSGTTTVAYSFSGAGTSTGSTSAAYPRMTFEYSTTNSPLPTFAWTPVTGLTPGTGIGANVNAAPGTTQVYTATASFNGCDATNSVTVTVNPLPVAQNVTGGGAYCIGGAGVPVGLDGSESGVDYQLVRNGVTNVGSPVPGDGNAIAFGNQTVAGTYTVLATNTTTLCTNTMAGNAVVSIDPLPVAGITGTYGPYCVSETGPIALTGVPTNGTGAWSGAGVSGDDFDPSGAGVGTHTLTYTVTSTNTCAGATATATVSVSVDPVATAGAGGSQTICPGGQAVVSGASASNGTILWTSNGSGSFNDATLLNPTYTAGPTDPGTTVTLTLTVSSTNACAPQQATATYAVTVWPRLTASTSLGLFTCGSPINPDVIFTFTGTAPYTFTYTFNGGSPQTVNAHPNATFTIPAAAAGNYQVTALSDASGCAPASLGAPILGGPYNNDLFFVYSVGNNYQDVTWSLFQTGTNNLVQTGQPFFNGNGSVPTCLPNGWFYLRVTDAGGDGIAGGYRLITQDGRRIIDNTENFNSGGVSAIANNGAFILPLGTDRPIFTSCDKMWWKTGEFLVAAENPAVSAVWVPNGTNAQQSPTSGYEFWWYNPNGGYSFRRFRSHTESDGYANVGATRACHVRLNNWATTNHLPEGVFLNVKVRGRVNGVNQNWGTACRFTLDNVLGNCPPTKLMDIPDHAQFSCGVERSLERGQRVYARTVRGATHYQWRFRVPAEEPNIQPVVVTTTTYILNLNTVALLYGKIYDVEVRVSKDGTTTWCGTGNQNPAVLSPKWGDVCLLTIALPPPMTGPDVEGITDGGGLRMWPNPNRGDQLWVNLDGIAAGVETVTVDLYDLSGKRIVAKVLPTQGTHLNTVLDLNGDLAGGMYLVHVTAGDKVYIERLVVQP